jgi:hypothetical protein
VKPVEITVKFQNSEDLLLVGAVPDEWSSFKYGERGAEHPFVVGPDDSLVIHVKGPAIIQGFEILTMPTDFLASGQVKA